MINIKVEIERNRYLLKNLSKIFTTKSLESLNIFARVLTCTSSTFWWILFWLRFKSHLLAVPQGGSSPQSPRPTTRSPFPITQSLSPLTSPCRRAPGRGPPAPTAGTSPTGRSSRSSTTSGESAMGPTDGKWRSLRVPGVPQQ